MTAGCLVRGAWLVALALPGCGGGCQAPSPSSESCDTQALAGTVTEVTLGRLDGSTFVAYADDDVATRVFGGQGFAMLSFRLRVRGAGLGDCIPQATRVYRGDLLEGSEELPLVADQVLPDTWLTGEALVIVPGLSGGERVTVEAEVGTVTARVELWVDDVGSADAQAPDAMAPDAMAADAMAPDAVR